MSGNGYSVEQAVYLGRPFEVDTIDHLLGKLEAFGVAISTSAERITVRITVDGYDANDALRSGQITIDNALDAEGLSPRAVASLSVIEAGELHDELWAEADQLVGVTELADLLAVTRQRASELRTREGFPAPVADLASGPVWRLSSLLRFMKTWERKPGRPRKDVTIHAPTAAARAEAIAPEVSDS